MSWNALKIERTTIKEATPIIIPINERKFIIVIKLNECFEKIYLIAIFNSVIEFNFQINYLKKTKLRKLTIIFKIDIDY